MNCVGLKANRVASIVSFGGRATGRQLGRIRRGRTTEPVCSPPLEHHQQSSRGAPAQSAIAPLCSAKDGWSLILALGISPQKSYTTYCAPFESRLQPHDSTPETQRFSSRDSRHFRVSPKRSALIDFCRFLAFRCGSLFAFRRQIRAHRRHQSSRRLVRPFHSPLTVITTPNDPNQRRATS